MKWNYGLAWFHMWFAVAVVAPVFAFASVARSCSTAALMPLIVYYFYLCLVVFIACASRIADITHRHGDSVRCLLPDLFTKDASARRQQALSIGFGFLVVLPFAAFGWWYKPPTVALAWVCWVPMILALTAPLLYDWHAVSKVRGSPTPPERFHPKELCSVENLAWLIITVASATIIVKWVGNVHEQYLKNNQYDPLGSVYFAEMIQDFFRYLLVAAIALFIGRMYKRHEELYATADTMKESLERHATQLLKLKDIASNTSVTFQNTLDAQAGLSHFLSVRNVVDKIRTRGARTQLLHDSWKDFAAKLDNHTTELTDFVDTVARASPAHDDSSTLVAIKVLSTYLEWDVAHVKSKQVSRRRPRGVIPELSTWFPHYAATVKGVALSLKSLPDGPQRFEFYATLPSQHGLCSFFNIANNGADPLWSIQFLNDFLWEQARDLQYRRYLLASQSPELKAVGVPDKDAYIGEYRKILSLNISGRQKAIAVPTTERWEQVNHELSAGLATGHEEAKRKMNLWLQGVDNQTAFQHLVALCNSLCKVDPAVEVRFITSDHVDRAKTGEFANQLMVIDRRLGFVDLLSVIKEYPSGPKRRGVDDATLVDANQRCDLDTITFDSLFPGREYFDLLAIYDKQRPHGGGWIACIVFDRPKSGVRTTTGRIFIDNVAGNDEKWKTMKNTLNTLFKKPPAYVVNINEP